MSGAEMPANRVLTILLGVAVVAALTIWWRARSHMRDAVDAGSESSAVALEAAAPPIEASRVTVEEESAFGIEPGVQLSTDTGEPDAGGARASLVYDSVGRSDTQVGGAAIAECEEKRPREECVAAFTECQHKSRSLDVCKNWFEPRDPQWAPDAEQAIRDFIADVDVLRLSAHPVFSRDGIPLDCRTTYCQVQLDVDRAALIDHLKSVGRYDGSYERGSRETRFLALTTRWADDRAKELRFALAYAGLLNDDSEVQVSGVVPAYHEEDAVLIITLHRCAKSKEHC
jgi:hypothetical protein